MGREVRMVPPGWEHPKDQRGHYVPLHGGLVERLRQIAMYSLGFVTDYRGGWMKHDNDYPADEYFGRTKIEDFMPAWPAEVCTHFQMYETTSEGTPISPPMPSPEALARWLADNNASAFGDDGASYEQWLAMIKRGWAPSAALVDGQLVSGVAALAEVKR